MGDLLYVTAGMWYDAQRYAERLGVPLARVRFIDDVEKLRGLRNITLHILDSAEARPDYDRILLEARCRGFEIV